MKKEFSLSAAHHDISVAVVVELVVACVSEMNPKTSPCAVEYLDGSVDPHLIQVLHGFAENQQAPKPRSYISLKL